MSAALALTGCIGALAQGTPAMEHRERADQQAHDAFPGADLVTVNAFEANASISDDEDVENRWNHTVEDDAIGDGAAPAWVYEYRTGDQTGYNIVVDEDGEIVHTERDDDVDEGAAPIEDWQITSTEAVEIVRDENDTWTVDEDGVAFYHLSRENGTDDPIWVMGESHEQHGLLVASVNATTGEFLGIESLRMGFGFGWSGSSGWGGGWSGWGSGSGSGWDDGNDDSPPPQEGGSFTGTVTLAEDTNEHAFAIDTDEHPELGLALSLQEPATGTVEVTLEGPDGELGSLEAGPQDTDDIETWDAPEEGSYVTIAELADGVDQAYELHWCAVGQPEGDQQAQQACDSVYRR